MRFRTPYGEKLAARDAQEAPYEGLPRWAKPSLIRWIGPFLKAQGAFANVDPNEVCLSIERVLRLELDWRQGAPQAVFGVMVQDDEVFLAVIEFALQNILWGWNDAGRATAELDALLREAGSVWRVVPDPSGEGHSYILERRTTPETQAALGQMLDRGGTDAQHMALAWSAAFGRQPDPSTAYREAVKAVEAAAQPIVLPNDAKATLGKVIASLRAAPTKWSFVMKVPVKAQFSGSQSGLTPLEVVVLMLDTLWVNQRDRHGEPEQRKVIQQREAEEAVHLALILVRFFGSGAVARL